MQVVLVMFRGEGERRSFSLPRDVTVMGRREDCDLRIPLGEVSRKHCRLIADGDALKIEDLGSSNGTFVNGQRIQGSPVNPGDVIQIGPVMFVVQIDGAPTDEEIQAPTPAVVAPSPDPEDTNMAVAAAAAARDPGPSVEEDLDDEVPSLPAKHADNDQEDELVDLAFEEIEEEKPRRNG
jgi:pSer/pThr/pTyr-binding forkhead associated (FHA) protein